MFSKLLPSRIFSRCLITKWPVVVPTTGTTISPPLLSTRTFRTTAARLDLMEFFDEKKNWGEKEVRVGRSWLVDELRLKSNIDLHKLWYVLLKEKNMLLTMKHDAKVEHVIFPNPERIDKVEESMENLETVVRERNKAYFLLETGTTGERSGEMAENVFGFEEYRQFDEHPVPMLENKQYLQKKAEEPKASEKEKAKYFAMIRHYKRRYVNRKIRMHTNFVYETLRLFPNTDHEALLAKYPLVTPEKLQKIVLQMKQRIHVNNYEPFHVARWGGRLRLRPPTWHRKYGG